jgi:hypothetical protein
MTERQFICWLKGYILHEDVINLCENQVTLIKNNLSKISDQNESLIEEGTPGDDDR